MTSSVAFAEAHAPDRIVAVGLLSLRALRYVAEGRPPSLPPVKGLRVEAVGHGESFEEYQRFFGGAADLILADGLRSNQMA